MSIRVITRNSNAPAGFMVVALVLISGVADLDAGSDAKKFAVTIAELVRPGRAFWSWRQGIPA
jgi:hypothetical protein